MSSPLRPRADRGELAFEPDSYGRSVQGRPLEVWLPAEPAEVLVFAGIHGEEPETTVALSSALRSLGPGQLRAAVVLAANPDGLARGTRGNARGVELNRNFPTADWTPLQALHRFTRGEPQDVALSPGPAAASEPESQALMTLVERLSPRLVVALHSPLGCVIDPLRGEPARWLSQRTGLPMRMDAGSPTPGTCDGWVRETTDALALTLELPVCSKDEALVRYLDPLVELLATPLAAMRPIEL